MPVTLTALFTYPIKSARGVALRESELGAHGLALDRHWMVVNPAGRQLTGREHPRLNLLEVSLEPGGLGLSAPGMPEVVVPYEPQGVACRVSVFGHPLEAREVSSDLNTWFSKYLSTPMKPLEARLVKFSPSSVRRMNPLHGDQLISFTDGNPLHLISEASLADLNVRLALPVTLERFRPNLVVYGDLPYAEDGWRKIRVGDLELEVVEATARCGMVNLAFGQMLPEPLRTLASYRRVGRSVLFGQNLTFTRTGTLRVGDEVQVLERQDLALEGKLEVKL